MQPKLLVVDDNEMNRDMLSRRLQHYGYETEVACDGKAALERMVSMRPDMVLLDVLMPELDGYQTLERIRANEELKDIPVIMISALDEVDSAVRCIETGAEDYLCKPVNAVLLKTKVAAILEKIHLRRREKELHIEVEKQNRYLEQRVEEQVKEISATQISAIFALSKLAESRDPETGEHLERVREYCRVLCLHLRNNPKYNNVISDRFISNIFAASPLHDIGKVGIPDHVLLKPGGLNEEEWRCMKLHPMIGAATLRAVDQEHPGNQFIQIGIEIAECHHEKWDGSGYPHGLKGEAIPLSARIMALGDVYDALTSKRCYKEAFDHDRSVGIITGGSGKHFDPDIVAAFIERQLDFKHIRETLIDSE